MTESYSSLVGRYGSQLAAAEAIGMPKSTFNDKYRREQLDPVMTLAKQLKMLYQMLNRLY